MTRLLALAVVLIAVTAGAADDAPITLRIPVPTNATAVTLSGNLTANMKVQMQSGRTRLVPNGDVKTTEGVVGPDLVIITKPLPAGKDLTITVVVAYTATYTQRTTPIGERPREQRVTVNEKREAKDVKVAPGVKYKLDFRKDEPKLELLK